MRAPRRRAASHASRTRKPAPSPRTKPLRVASKGRLARSGVSLSGERAPSRQKLARPIGLIIESKPPGEDVVGRAAPDQLHAPSRRPDCRRRRRCGPRWRSRGSRSGGAGGPARRRSGCGRRPADRIAKPSVSSRSGWKSPSGAQWRCTSPELAEPQARHCRCPPRRPSASRRRPPAGSRHRATPPRPRRGAKRCERLANLRSLRSSIARRGSKSFTSAAMRTGKPLASKWVIGADTAAARQQGVPGGGDVVPERGHEAQPGDGDPARALAVMPAPARRSPAARWRPVSRPTIAARVSSAAPSVPTGSPTSISTACPGRMNERIFTSATRARPEPLARRQRLRRRAAAPAGSGRRAGAWPERRGGAGSGRRKRARIRARAWRARSRWPGIAVDQREIRRRGYPGSGRAGAPGPQSVSKSPRTASGASKSSIGSIGPTQRPSSRTGVSATRAHPP